MPSVWSLVIMAHVLMAMVTIAFVLRSRGEPLAMLSWILAIAAIPVLGVGLYALVGSNRIRRKASRRRRKVAHLIERIEREAHERASGSRVGGAAPTGDLAMVEKLSRRLVQLPAVAGNQVDVYGEAEETYAALEEAIRSARHHIHLQYYIWKPDETGEHFRDLLIEQAKRGVRCRVLLDAVGCMRLSRSFYQPWLDAGVQVGFFMPFLPLRRRRWSPHLRNHRKIAVIDGETALVGSQNIGDEYRGRLKRLSPWYDTHMRVRGPAAIFLQQIFAEDWVFATGEVIRGEGYFESPPRPGESIVQIVPTGPDQDVSVLGQLAFAAVTAATKSIRIVTPYFVPYPALRLALVHACYRDVRVQLVLPTRSDNSLVLWAGRSFYPELLDAGAEIYEFDGGMLHSKILTLDDRWCMLGSANMDVRSFRLNFEITALIYDEKVAAAQAAAIDDRCRQSRRILPHDVWSRPLSEQLLTGAARLFTPLL
ncbi:MAG: cardiolipin synthase [Planctomycetes bacterium]|nr:cardiolipin synthase [Planctomycetota bacterium]